MSGSKYLRDTTKYLSAKRHLSITVGVDGKDARRLAMLIARSSEKLNEWVTQEDIERVAISNTANLRPIIHKEQPNVRVKPAFISPEAAIVIKYPQAKADWRGAGDTESSDRVVIKREGPAEISDTFTTKGGVRIKIK